MDEGQEETLEFYRIKLDERDTQINTLTILNKKMDLDKKREIKAAQIAESQANFALREERVKNEKGVKKMQDMEQSKQELDKKIERAVEERTRIENEKKVLQERFNEQKEEYRKYQHIFPSPQFLQKISTTVEALRGYEELHNTLEDRTKEVGKLEEELATTKELCLEELQQKEKVVAEIKAKKQEVERIMRENSSRISDLETATAHLKKENGLLMSDLEHSTELVAQLERKNEEFMAEVKHAEKTNDELEEKLQNQSRIRMQQVEEASREEYKRCQQEMEVLRHKFEDQQKHLVYNFQSIEESLSDKLEAAIRERDRVSREASEVKEELELAQDRHNAEIKTKEEEIMRVAGLNDNYGEEFNKLQNQIIASKNDRSKTDNELKKLTKVISELEQKNHLVSEERESLQGVWAEEKSQLLSEIQRGQKEMSHLKEENQEMVTENHRLMTQMETLSKQLGERSRNNSLYPVEQHHKEEGKEENRSRNETNEALNVIANEEKKQSGDEERRLERQLRNERQRTQELEEENDKLKQSANTNEALLKQLKQQVQSLKQQNLKLRDGATINAKYKMSLENEITQLKSQANELKSQITFHKSQVTKLESELSTLQIPTCPTEDSTVHFTSRINSLSTHIEQLSCMNSDLSHELSQLRAKSGSVQESLQLECNEYIQEIIKMKVKVAQSETRAEEKVYQYNKLKKKQEEMMAQRKP